MERVDLREDLRDASYVQSQQLREASFAQSSDLQFQPFPSPNGGLQGESSSFVSGGFGWSQQLLPPVGNPTFQSTHPRAQTPQRSDQGVLENLDVLSTRPTLSRQTSSASSVDKRSTKYVSKRSSATLASQNGDVLLSARRAQLPVGPYNMSHHDLKEVVLREANNPETMGGGFGIRIGKCQTQGHKQGTTCTFHCSEKDKSNCTWELLYEYTTEGWFLYKFNNNHSHTLKLTQAEVMVTGSGRQIPTEFDDLGELLAESGFSAKDIHRVFVTRCRREGNAFPTFKCEDVYDRFVRASAHTRQFDATNLLVKLAERRLRTGLQFFHDVDNKNKFDRLWVECAHGQTVWGSQRSSYIIDNVLFFDPTFGTNSYGMKLSMFCTVDSEGFTKVIAYMLHHEEDYEDVYWGLNCFHAVFLHAPVTFLTDGGTGIVKAAVQMTREGGPWQQCVHLLCVYHIDQNFYTHLHCLFAWSRDYWKTLHNMFWKIAKCTDFSHQDSLEQEFDDMVSFVRQHARGQPATIAKALEWMEKFLKRNLAKWAACYTWFYFSAGAHATSRAESTNGVIKDYLVKNSSLLQIHDKLEDYNQFKEFKDSCILQARLVRASRFTAVPMWVLETKDHVSDYAYNVLLGQLGQVMAYQVTPVPASDYRSDVQQNSPPGTNFLVKRVDNAIGIHQPERLSDGRTKSHSCNNDLGLQDCTVERWTSSEDCSCQFKQSWGVPCRCILAVRLFKPLPTDSSLVSLFAERWVKRSHQQDSPYALVQHSNSQSNVSGLALTTSESRSFVSLTTVLRQHGFEPLAFSGVFEPNAVHNYDGGYLVIKYGSQTQGGWHIAKMKKVEESSSMELRFVYGKHDEEGNPQTSMWSAARAVHLMVRPPLVPADEHPMSSWMLVAPAPLGTNVTEDGCLNPASQKAGRKSNRRQKAWGGGPLAK